MQRFLASVAAIAFVTSCGGGGGGSSSPGAAQVTNTAPTITDPGAPGSVMVGAVLVTCAAPGDELPPPPPPQEVTNAIAATLAKNLCIPHP